MPAHKGRVKISSLGRELSVVITVRKSPWRILTSSVILAVFIAGLILALSDMDDTEEEAALDPFDIALSLFFLCGIGLQFIALLWPILGRETIRVTGSKLKVRRHVFVGGHTRKYELREAVAFRVGSQEPGFIGGGAASELFGQSGGRIAFDYRGSTHWFGLGLETGEAESILEQMRRLGLIPS